MKSFLDRFRKKGADDAPDEAATDSEKKPETVGEVVQSSIAKAAAEAPPGGNDHEVRLELGDFLHRIPQNLLRPGPHDVGTVLRFDIADLSARIAKGQTTINLAEIHSRVPQIFRAEVRAADNIEVRFPWQKLMNLLKTTDSGVPAGSSLTIAAAESLAQKLRNRRPARNVIPGTQPTAPGEAPPAATEKPAAARGGRSRQPNWFSKPGAENNPLTGPASAPLSVVPPSKPATPAEPESASTFTQESLKLVETPAPETPQAVAPDAPETPEIDPTNPEETAKLGNEELARALQAANFRLAQVKGEHERQMVAIAQEREAIAQERDNVLSDLERARKELADKLDHIHFQESVTAKTTESAAKAATDLGNFQKDLAARTAELDALKAEIEGLKKAGDEKAAVLAKQRDALAQEKRELTAQLAKATAAITAKPVITGEGERSKKEYQRQLDELQRRIIGFESSQREAAQELSRERETRIKAERALTSADRARQEASALIETMRSEGRRDSEAAARKRDAEFARTQKELHEKHDALADASHKIAAERDSLAAEVERLKSAVLDVTASPPDAGWEARAVASLEEDIAKYRVRIKTLLAERDTIAGEKEKLAAELSTRPTAADVGAADEARAKIEAITRERDEAARELEQLRATHAQASAGHDDLRAQSSALAAEKAETLQQLDAARKVREQHLLELESARAAAQAAEATVAGLRAEIEKITHAHAESSTAEPPIVAELRTQLGALAKERDGVQGDWEKLVAELDALKTQHRQDEEKFANDRAALQQQGAAGSAELQQQIAGLEKTVAALTADREELNGKLFGAQAALEQAKGEHENQFTGLSAEHAAITASLARTTSENQSTLNALRLELDAARAGAASELEATRAAAAADLAAANSALDAARTRFEDEQTALAKVQGELEQKLADANRALDQVSFRAQELDTTVQAREAALREKHAETARIKAEHEGAVAKLVHDHEQALISLTSDKDRQLAALQADKAKALAALSRERDDLAAQLAAETAQLSARLADTDQTLSARIAALTGERDEARRESTALAQRLAAFAVEADQKFDDLQKAHETMTGERHSIAAELEGAKEAHKAQSAVFAREFKAVVKQRDDAVLEAAAARSEAQEKAAALAKEKSEMERAEADLTARFERETARLRRERDVIARQRDDLRDRIGRMVEEQRQMLEELAAQSARQTPLPNDVVQTTREPREANVIDITEAELVQPVVEFDRGINLPRIRPVPIPPPNVRIL